MFGALSKRLYLCKRNKTCLEREKKEESTMMYKNIVFDLGNVLVKLDEHETMKRFEQLGLKEAGHISDNPEMLKLLQEMGIGLLSNREFFDSFRRIANTEATDEQITDAANAMLRYIPDEKSDQVTVL